MRTAILVFAIAACGGPSSRPPPITARATAPALRPPAVPSVASASVLARGDGAPPILVLIDARGARSLAAAASWADVSIGKWSAGPKPASDEGSARYVEQAAGRGKDPKLAVEGFVDGPAAATPPEDDGADEAGGTGTAMALEEGKMGQRDADRTEGQYKMARPHGARGPRRGGFATLTGNDDADPRRSTIVGEVTDDKLTDVPAVVIADPGATAAAVVRAASDLQAMIGVAHGGTIRPLNIQFQGPKEGAASQPGRWFEVRLAASGLTVEEGVSERVSVAWAELNAKLKPALAQLREGKTIAVDAPVDVLVEPDVRAQQLVDVLVALEAADITTIGLGMARPRVAPTPRTPATTPEAAELDKPTIRSVIRRQLPKIQHCYEKELVIKPNLQGTVTVHFAIHPSGKVVTATASGVDPAVASCVAAAIEAIQFPAWNGVENMTVTYPFTFRPGQD